MDYIVSHMGMQDILYKLHSSLQMERDHLFNKDKVEDLGWILAVWGIYSRPSYTLLFFTASLVNVYFHLQHLFFSLNLMLLLRRKREKRKAVKNGTPYQ